MRQVLKGFLDALVGREVPRLTSDRKRRAVEFHHTALQGGQLLQAIADAAQPSVLWRRAARELHTVIDLQAGEVRSDCRKHLLPQRFIGNIATELDHAIGKRCRPHVIFDLLEQISSVVDQAHAPDPARDFGRLSGLALIQGAPRQLPVTTIETRFGPG
ncbi:MAG: hypothetical protein C0511_08240 [Hyphomicrobium sp.]|nr:hypothetical protein [Hyphomicrobium sp.]PPC82137.1 MAG: hypothetical protein CTY40_05545 [Hyphomicrobium sp.]